MSRRWAISLASPSIIELAVVEDVGPVGDAEGHVDVLLDDEDACPGLVGDAPHHREHALHDDGCQAEAHLVDQQDLGLGHEGACHGQHLLLATRQEAGSPVLQGCEGGNMSMARS